ncbi:MAG: hypothetical protein ACYYK0_03990 [Candidatus Eutrophobiaceae bacterium]
MLLLIVAFSLGYIVNNVAEDWSFGLIADAEAEVAGMDRYDLKYDYDFKKAVEDIIESCAVDGDELDC